MIGWVYLCTGEPTQIHILSSSLELPQNCVISLEMARNFRDASIVRVLSFMDSSSLCIGGIGFICLYRVFW